MTTEEIGRILAQVTEEILARMRRSGFQVDPDSPVRYDPLVWDINNGHCDAWAERAAQLIPGAFATWMDPYHCVLVHDGLFYDADSHGGVRDYHDLPMFADPAHKRPKP